MSAEHVASANGTVMPPEDFYAQDVKTAAERETEAGDARIRATVPGTGSSPAAPPEPIPSMTTADIFAPLAPIDWMCEGLKLTKDGGVVMFAGYGDSAKSIVAQHMGLCVVAGLPIFGVHAVNHGRVLHLDYEQGAWVTRDRYQRLARGMGLDFDKLIAEDRLHLAVFPHQKLDGTNAEEVLAATVAGFDFVIIDSNRAASPDTEENASKARVPLDMLSSICVGKCVPVVIHHARKPTKDNKQAGGGARMVIRGSSALFDALTGCFVFEGSENRKLNDPVRVFHEKERIRNRKLDPFLFRVVDVAQDGNPSWGLKIEIVPESEGQTENKEEVQAAQSVLNIVVQNPGLTKNVIADKSNFGVPRVRKLLQRLLDAGNISAREAKGKNNLPTEFYDPVEGKESYTPRPPSMAVEDVEDSNATPANDNVNDF